MYGEAPVEEFQNHVGMGVMNETAYRIYVSDERIGLLKAKLDLAVLPDELDDAGWDYGTPLGDVSRLVDYWKNGFDWKEQEKAINDALPQFTRDIAVDGQQRRREGETR